MSKYGVFSAPYFSLFSSNEGKYGPEKLCIWTLFTHCDFMKLLKHKCSIQFLKCNSKFSITIISTNNAFVGPLISYYQQYLKLSYDKRCLFVSFNHDNPERLINIIGIHNEQ